MFTSEAVARSALRRQVLHWRAQHQNLLPLDLPGTYSQRKKRPLLSQRRRGGGSRIPSVSALPAGMFSWNAGLAGNVEHVSRALRLIGESGLEDGGMEGLAERLGVGSDGIFGGCSSRHLGAPPSAVAQTRRLHFAKKLIDETQLPMT